MPDIIVTGWGAEAGPAYKIVSIKLDRKRHKRVRSEEIVREQSGRSSSKPGHATVNLRGGDSYLLLNRGSVYTVTLDVNGTQISGAVDATDDYRVILIDDTLVSVTPVGVVQQGEPEGDHQNLPSPSDPTDAS